MNLPSDLNTIFALIIIVLIIVLYYTYYFIKNMIHEEIKDFYIKTEKIRIKKNKKDKELYLEQQNLELKQQLENQNMDFQINNFDNINDEEELNNLEIESFVDPIKNKDKEQDQNKILADRVFGL